MISPRTAESYPAARTAAPTRARAFRAPSRRRARAGRGRTGSPRCRRCEAIEAMIDAAFWASLRREEGYVPKISLALSAARAGAASAACSSGRCRSTPAALAQGRAGGRARRHPSRRLAATATRCGLGHHARGPDASASCSKSPRRACSSSSTTAASEPASSSTSRCSRAIRSRSSTRTRRACPTARRC